MPSKTKNDRPPRRTPSVQRAAPEVIPAVRESGLIRTRDDTPIYYEIRGEGLPLIMCYGLLCRREHWRYQIDFFSRKYQVILFDYRGHHRSGAPANDQHLTIGWCASDVQDLMDHLRLEEVAALGHSMGVAVLTELAAADARVRAIIQICGSVHNPFAHMLFTDRINHLYRLSTALYDMAPKVMTGIWSRFTEPNPLSYFMTAFFGFNPTCAEQADILGYMKAVHETPTDIFFALLKDYTQVDRRPLLGDVECPALVIAGEGDWITPLFIQDEMASLLPHGELVKILDGSHNAHMDFPEVVNAEISKFLTRIKYV